MSVVQPRREAFREFPHLREQSIFSLSSAPSLKLIKASEEKVSKLHLGAPQSDLSPFPVATAGALRETGGG